MYKANLKKMFVNFRGQNKPKLVSVENYSLGFKIKNKNDYDLLIENFAKINRLKVFKKVVLNGRTISVCHYFFRKLKNTETLNDCFSNFITV